ncbi:MAG: hypothetical protein Q9157_007766 [Trypethelium eluteriae]
MSFSNETQGGVYGEYEKLSFQPEYLQRFQADEQLLAKLPEVLRKCLTGIQQNAAAILTSIDRFKALRAEAVHRGWPEHKARLAILNAKTTGRTLAAGAARAERAYSKESSGLSESWGSPVSTSDPSSPLVSPESQGFDEPAWEFYISTLEAEREFLQRQLMVDMQHRIHEFKKLCYELGEHLPPSFSWERRRASSNGDLGSECPPPCDFLYHTLGREERARFNSWWEMDIVAWFLVTRRECSEFGIPTVEEAVNERKDMKLTVSS